MKTKNSISDYFGVHSRDRGPVDWRRTSFYYQLDTKQQTKQQISSEKKNVEREKKIYMKNVDHPNKRTDWNELTRYRL